MLKTLLFLMVVVMVSAISIGAYRHTYKAEPIIVEKEVVREVPKEVVKEVIKVIEKEVPVIEYVEKEKIVYVEKPKPIEPPVCPRCGKRHW